ncbi:MAG: hypothetical protein PSU93_00525 [Methylobacter sp.]|uniref:Prepilin-type N-terminal cleavage/methylation domain-containing protein n=1 Tax=Candidatus Methylobacter titanis TaxID=3053457 RepID=A0AA43Q2N6_9GAMM|nr:hypothetical protein [Candidatus Methylobacter titanis]
MKKPPLTTKQQGFSLFELAIVLTVTAGLGVALFSVTTNHFTQLQRQRNADALAVADRQLLHYAAIHGRLPCPDSTNDGLEDCDGSAKGTLPYKTIGLIANAYTPGEVPLRYGVYRKADDSVVSQDAAVSKDADLAALGNKNRFEPTSSDNCSYDINNDKVIVTDSATPVCPGVKSNNYQDAGLLRHGTLDLCLALKNGSTHAASTLHTFTQPPAGAGADNPVAYALAAAGANGVFDDVNNSSSFGFNSPATPAQTTYDDQTLARSFAEVFQHLRCEVAMQSLHLLADTVAVDDEVKAQQQAMKDQAEQAVQDSIMGAISAGLSVALAIAAVVEANELSAAAAAALTAHTLGCAASLGLNVVSCAAIPFAAAALASAGTALGLAYTAVALNTAAMAAQIAAAIMFDQVAAKAGAATVPPSADLITAQKQQLASAVDNRDDSYESYLSEQNAANLARTEANNLAIPATAAYNASITTIDTPVETPLRSTVAPGLTAITALDTAIAALTSVDDSNKTAAVNQWDAAVKAAQVWDIDASGGGKVATCTALPIMNTGVLTPPFPPYPLYWWPTYTIQAACTLAGKFQDALDKQQQYLAKANEATRLESSVIQKYNNWKSAVAMVEQTVCAQTKKTYVTAAGIPADIRLAVVPEWPTVAPPLILAKVAAIEPETGTVPGSPPVYTRAGSGAAYSWWGSCSDIAGGSGTLISITPGARPILKQADQLGLTQ